MDDKLKRILKNIVDKCDGITFYYVELDGALCSIYKRDEQYLIDIQNYGSQVNVDKIRNVTFDDDVFFATFEDENGFIRGLNIVKDMSSQQIIEELA